MLVIKKLAKQIKEEICKAEAYARDALDWKEKDKVLADAYFAAANDRLRDMDLLHEQVVRIIANYRKEKGEPPADMQARYDYIHEEQIEDVREVRILLELYKSNT